MVDLVGLRRTALLQARPVQGTVEPLGVGRPGAAQSGQWREEGRSPSSLLQEPERGLPKLELKMLRSLRAYLHGVFSGYPFHVGLPIALVLLNELEVQDLSVWIEAKAASIPSEVFEPYLLMDTKTVLTVPG